MHRQRTLRVGRIDYKRPSCSRRTLPLAFSTSACRDGYEDTLGNLKIGAYTKVIFQGFTGKQATANAIESMRWGTNIVGGVKPHGSGEHLGKPVLATVRAAMEQLRPDATGIYVAAHQASAAIEEAIEAEVPLIVAVAEHIPLHDTMRIHSMLSTQSKSRLVGANTPGLISAVGRCRIGFQPLPIFSPGSVGVVAKSGTLSYEAVASLTRAGVGQSLCIGIGGDVMSGTSFVDALRIFEHDEDTKGIVLVGELGGTAEEEAAEWIKEYHTRTKNPKPIAAVIGGFRVPSGKVMGHAGAWTGLGEGTAQSKYRALEQAKVAMVDHPAQFGVLMKAALTKMSHGSKIDQPAAAVAHAQQRRRYHTTAIRHRSNITAAGSSSSFQQRRCLHLLANQCSSLLDGYNIKLTSLPCKPASSHYLGISPSRSSRSPSIIAAPVTESQKLVHRVKRFPFDYLEGPTARVIDAAIEYAQLDAAPPMARAQTVELIHNIWRLYCEREAVDAHFSVAVSESQDEMAIYDAYLVFDDAAYQSCQRQQEIRKLCTPSSGSFADREAGEAEEAGIVYVPLVTRSTSHETHDKDTRPRNLVGTLANGAGLAMNTNDVLHARLFPSTTTCANFLDTGGKATRSTIHTSLKLVLSDPRVGVVFINIFGGLTLCDMIAQGILLAFQELDVKKPVVVRLRGTNEALGQRILDEANLPIHVCHDFADAVQKVGELCLSGVEGMN